MFALLALLVAQADAVPATPVAAAPVSDGLRILVIAPGADQARVEAIYSGLRAAGLSPVELDERAGVDGTLAGAQPMGLGNREEARAHLQEAKARFRDLDLEETRNAYEAALQELLRLERPEESMEIFSDSLLLRANAALQLGVEAEAREALTLLARLQPDLTELHPGMHPPSLVQAYASARSDELSRLPGVLIVRPRVAGFAPFALLVDGAPLAASNAPGIAQGLRQGPHLVTVRAPGAIPFSRIVDLGADPLVLEPFLAPVDAAAARAALVVQARDALTNDTRTKAFEEIADLSAARAVLYLDQNVVQLYVAGRPLELLRASPTADGALLGRATLAALQAPARRDQGLPVPDEVDPAFAVGSVIGGGAGGLVVAAGAVVGAIVLFSEAARQPPPARPLDFTCCVR